MTPARALAAVWEAEDGSSVQPAMALLWDRNARLEQELRHTITELEASRARVVTAADSERRRIERDLHDGAQSRLIAMQIRLGLAADGSVDPQSLVADLLEDTRAALEELQALVRGIYPSLLDDAGLPDALRSLARRAPLPTGVVVHGLSRYSRAIETAVYFSCAEAIQNCARHAGPGAAATIHVHADERRLIFEVEDNGRGFDLDEARRGSGITNMRDRVGAVGGRLEIRSSLSGATVRGTLPLTDR